MKRRALLWAWRLLGRPYVEAWTAEISQGSWCKVAWNDCECGCPAIRCNQSPGHAGPHAFIIEES